MNLFNDSKKVRDIVNSAYKKLKTYFYYNNSLLYMRKKISEFEYDEEQFSKSLNDISEVLCHPRKSNSLKQVNGWVDKIDFLVLPKSFDEEKHSENVISNMTEKNRILKKVNFFIDAPIELHILDLIWCMYIGKYARDKNLLSRDSYAYKFNTSLFVKTDNDLDIINLKTNRVFENYYDRYMLWRNNAINEMSKRYNENQSSLLISLDIKNYYYSVMFNFKKFRGLMKGTAYKNINNLTCIIEKMYKRYTELISYYRDDIDLNTGKIILPIGLLSSGLIANIYLFDFDKLLRTNLEPLYYGRYVDDILIVVDGAPFKEKEVKAVDIINKCLVKNKIVILENESFYSLVKYKELKIQIDKLRILHIVENAPKGIMDIILNEILNISSESNLLPDLDDTLLSNETAKRTEKNDIRSLLKDIEFLNQNKYNAIRYITNYLWKYHNVVRNDSPDFKNELKEICLFFNGNTALELYISWTKILTFFLICAEKIHFQDFYKSTKKNIESMPITNIENIKKSKLKIILSKVKKALMCYLDIAISTASALDIKYLNTVNGIKQIKLSKKIRKANMFNFYHMSYPGINYTHLARDINISYLNQNIEFYSRNFAQDEFSNDLNTVADYFVIEYSPKFIHLDEFFILTFIRRLHEKRWSDVKVYEHILKYYLKTIKKESWQDDKYLPFIVENRPIDNRFYNKEYIIKKYKFNNYSYFKLNISKKYLLKKTKIKIALANVNISQQECENPILDKSNSSYTKKVAIYDFLKNIMSLKVDIFVMPELYIPISWLSELVYFSRKTQKMLIFGLEYIKNGDRIHNHIVTVIPSTTFTGLKTACVFIREKNDYSPLEQEQIAKLGKRCYDSTSPLYHQFEWKGLDFTCFNCFELTDIVARSFFKSQIDILFTVEYNQDTNYFSSIINSTSRDLHCYVVQSNTSQYGDSRITLPSKTDLKDILKIKGGDNNSIVVGTVDIEKLNEFQAEYYDSLKDKVNNAAKANHETISTEKKPLFKPLPANYDNSRSKIKLLR